MPHTASFIASYNIAIYSYYITLYIDEPPCMLDMHAIASYNLKERHYAKIIILYLASCKAWFPK